MAKPKKEEQFKQRTIGMPEVTYARLDKLRRKINESGKEKKESWPRFLFRVLPILEMERKR